jgi:hypothetical protein
MMPRHQLPRAAPPPPPPPPPQLPIHFSSQGYRLRPALEQRKVKCQIVVTVKDEPRQALEATLRGLAQNLQVPRFCAHSSTTFLFVFKILREFIYCECFWVVLIILT